MKHVSVFKFTKIRTLVIALLDAAFYKLRIVVHRSRFFVLDLHEIPRERRKFMAKTHCFHRQGLYCSLWLTRCHAQLKKWIAWFTST